MCWPVWYVDQHNILTSMICCRLLSSTASTLNQIAFQYNVAIVVINHITTRVTEGRSRILPALGEQWSHCITNRCALHGIVQSMVSYHTVTCTLQTDVAMGGWSQWSWRSTAGASTGWEYGTWYVQRVECTNCHIGKKPFISSLLLSLPHYPHGHQRCMFFHVLGWCVCTYMHCWYICLLYGLLYSTWCDSLHFSIKLLYAYVRYHLNTNADPLNWPIHSQLVMVILVRQLVMAQLRECLLRTQVAMVISDKSRQP